MKNTYLIVGVIIALVLVGFFFMNKGKSSDLEKNTGDTNKGINTTFVNGDYKIDTENSVIRWVGEYAIGGINHKGTLKLSSGNAVVKDGNLTSGDFVIDMNTLAEDTGNAKLIGHLKSDDFFSVSKFSESKFVLKSFDPSIKGEVSNGRYLIGGDLTIKGITKPIYFTATINSEPNNVISAKAVFAINRADWEIKYNSPSFFKDIGDKAIRDAVEIELDLRAIKVIQ